MSKTLLIFTISAKSYDEISDLIRAITNVPGVSCPMYELVDGNMMIRMGGILLAREGGNYAESNFRTMKK